MSAPTGNKHAERWTREKTIHYLSRIEKYIQTSDVVYLGHALLHVGLYNDIWAYWKEKWQDDEQIYDRMMMIRQHFENRIYTAALRKEVHVGVAMFTLKVHYVWCIAKPAKENPVPSEPKAAASAPRREPVTETTISASKDVKPLVMKTFPDTRHLIPVSSYCGLPTFIEAGKHEKWAQCGKRDFVRVER